jgi:chromosome partitioning protein
MPIIPFVSPKGGTCKTTSALLLSTFLANLYDVTIIDADPNCAIRDWALGGNAPPRLTVVSDVNEGNIVECIEDAAAKTPIVIVDLEGTASKMVIYGIAQADFVIIPMQASYEDAKAARRAVGVILQSEKESGRAIPHAVLFTRTSPMIRSRSFTHIHKSVVEAGIPVFQTELNERDAYKAVLLFQQTLDGLDPKEVPNLDKARRNIVEFAQEVVERIMADQGGREEQTAPVARRVGGLS